MNERCSSNSRHSRFQNGATWLAFGIAVLLFLWGIVNYGLQGVVNPFFWDHIFGRLGGPMTFRFVLQPIMALVAAVTDVMGSDAFGISRLPLRPDAARLVLFGLSIDLIYQLRMYHHFYPVEALLLAVALALVPYLGVRWILTFGKRLWFARRHR